MCMHTPAASCKSYHPQQLLMERQNAVEGELHIFPGLSSLCIFSFGARLDGELILYAFVYRESRVLK